MPATSSRRLSATTKSSPWSRKAWIGPGTSGNSRERTVASTSLPVMSGFCSEPDSANSRAMIRRLSTNQVWSWPVRPMWASVATVSKPGNSGAGRRLPVASNHIEDGAGRIRMPWFSHTGSQLRMPSV